MVNSIVGLPNPVALLSSKLEDKSVRAAFDKAAKDWKITQKEISDLFTSASSDNPYVPGDSTMPSELRDLHRIREDGAFLMAKSVAKSFDSKLAKLDALPKVSLKDDDMSLTSDVVAVNTIALKGTAAGRPAPKSKSPSTVRVTVGDDAFEVRPNKGESAFTVLSRLQAEVKKGGYQASVMTAKTPGGYSVLEIKGPSKAAGVKVGDYGVFSGTVDNRQNFGIGGEAPPSGSWLVLDKPITVEGKSVKDIFLGYQEFQDGVKARLNGRLDTGSWGGVETHGGSYYTLSGISDLKAGEPAYDGKNFKNAAGEVLTSGYYNRPLIMDAPAVLFVFDPASGSAFKGSYGGMMPPGMNYFHGFNDSAKIKEASAADKKALSFDADGVPSNKAGKALTQVTEHTDGPVIADGMATAWWLDAEANKLYHVNNGGIAGFHNFISSVIDFDAI